MHRSVVTALLLILLAPAVAAADERADAVAARTLEAMGGADGLRASRCIRFNFFGSRTHHWDQATGDHRLEGKNREGQSYVVLHNVETRKGRVWVDGDELSGEDLGKWLERAYGGWINDTYWLLMPYKLRDPGVTLVHAGHEEIDGVRYDKLELTFDSVGLTPGDTYWAYINPETHLMDRWAYHLQGWEDDREPSAWTWTDWQRHGRIMLSSKRVGVGNDREASLGEIAVFESLPASVFESPAAIELDATATRPSSRPAATRSASRPTTRPR